MKILFLFLFSLALVFPIHALEWENLDQSSRISGRKLSSAYMTGKVVLVSRDETHAKRLQDVWKSFKSKPFILLGSYDKTPAGVTFPVYKEANIDGAPAAQMYVVDALGDVVYNGAVIPDAIEAVVISLTNLAVPPDYSSWKKYFEFEAKELPGKALLRLADAAKDKKLKKVAFSNTEKKARQPIEKTLKNNPVFARLAKLESFSSSVKDSNRSKKRQKVSKAQVMQRIKEFEDLKTHENPIVSREAKNCLADLAYAAAEM